MYLNGSLFSIFVFGVGAEGCSPIKLYLYTDIREPIIIVLCFYFTILFFVKLIIILIYHSSLSFDLLSVLLNMQMKVYLCVLIYFIKTGLVQQPFFKRLAEAAC